LTFPPRPARFFPFQTSALPHAGDSSFNRCDLNLNHEGFFLSQSRSVNTRVNISFRSLTFHISPPAPSPPSRGLLLQLETVPLPFQAISPTPPSLIPPTNLSFSSPSTPLLFQRQHSPAPAQFLHMTCGTFQPHFSPTFSL